MAQGIFDNIVPSTTSGNQLATLLNSFKDAYVSGNSGTSRPSQLTAGGSWIDTTNNPTSWDYKIYNGTSDITVFTLNLTSGLVSMAGTDTLLQITKISSDSIGPILRFLKQRAGGTQTQVGDILGEVDFYGTRDDTVTTLQARLRSVSTDNTTSTSRGASLIFELATTGGASVAEVMKLVDGKLGIGMSAPLETLHIKGNFKAQTELDSTVGPIAVFAKKRVSGAVQSGDVLGLLEFRTEDASDTEFASAQLEVSATENHTSTALGSKFTIRTKKIGEAVYSDQLEIGESVTVKTNLTVDGTLTVSGTTTSVNSTTLDVSDSNISVNKGGTQSSANTNKAGLKVEMSDATHAQIGYDSSKNSKFVMGNVGSEAEVVTVSHTQILTNKTLSGASIQTPTRADVKTDTEANLTTYAVSASNGQWCFATDTKVMYQVIDGALVPAGAGGGGTTLRWNDSGLAPLKEFSDGFELALFDSSSNQELYAILAVPMSYRTGKQIKLKSGQFFNSSTTGNVLFRSTTALISTTTVFGTYTNTRTSTNTQVTVAAVSNTITGIGDIDITDTSGLINGVSVVAGNKLRIRLYRDNTNETSGAANDAKLLLDSFEPTFS